MQEKEINNKDTDFAKSVYKILRDYQDNKIPQTQVSVGVLSSKLTVVFDLILEAARQKETRRHITAEMTWFGTQARQQTIQRGCPELTFIDWFGVS